VTLEQKCHQAESKINDLEISVQAIDTQVDDTKETLEDLRVCTEANLKELKDKLLYYEVYQRRENLRFYGIEEKEDEDPEKEIYEGRSTRGPYLHGVRIHRVGQRRDFEGRPRAISHCKISTVS
jgi:hypothetical protein